jgi:lipoate-protein ligase B
VRQQEVSILCRLVDLRLIDYFYAWEFQKECLNKIRYSGGLDTLIFCQHPHTITQGRISKGNSILISESEMRRFGIDFYNTDRGGDVTYHGPGQLVIYPIFNLEDFKKDIKYFLSNLEEVVIKFLRVYGINAERRNGYTGVWISDRKIASIGIGIKKWITYHGIAVNICTELKYFSFIRPCGLDIEMTSVSKELNKEINIDRQLKQNLLRSFEEVFSIEIMEV